MLTAAEVSHLSKAAFLEVFGSVVEASPWVASMVWEARPFAGAEQLCAAFEQAIRSLSTDRQLAIIKAHPDLVGRAALAGTLNPDSAKEQASAGLDGLSVEEVAEFQRLNAAYRARFGFPFVMCVRENRKQAIMAGMTARLECTKAKEISTAIEEICKIVRLRLIDRVSP